MSDYNKRIIYLSDAQRQELFTNDSITVNGKTIIYDPTDIYVTPQDAPLTNIQINGTSVVTNGVAEIPMADSGVYGVLKTAETATIKTGSTNQCAITPYYNHTAIFYGLAKAAGDSTQSASSNAVGTYTPEAKAAIQSMLGIDLSSIAQQVEIPLVETVTGTTPSITGQPNVRYICGEVTSITITPPSAGSIDVIFTSGSSPAVLTLPSTVSMPVWFDSTVLDANTKYEILITDGEYGSVMSWPI